MIVVVQKDFCNPVKSRGDQFDFDFILEGICVTVELSCSRTSNWGGSKGNSVGRAVNINCVRQQQHSTKLQIIQLLITHFSLINLCHHLYFHYSQSVSLLLRCLDYFAMQLCNKNINQQHFLKERSVPPHLSNWLDTGDLHVFTC